MDTTPRPLRQERITELVTHLTGAPMDQARVAVTHARSNQGPWSDSLTNIAEALVSLRTAA